MANNPNVTYRKVNHVHSTKELLARAKEEGYYELFLLELSTGMRRGEIVGLKWSDFNASTGSLRIARQANRVKGKTVIQPPKTKTSIRTVVLPQDMTEILTEMK